MAASPLECVRLTAKRRVRIWIGKHHIESGASAMGKALVFSPEEIEPGGEIIIDGLHNVYYCKGRICYQARIYDVGVNIDRYGIGTDEEFRSAASRILPFQHGVGNGIFSVSRVHSVDEIPQASTDPIADDVRDEMLENADLLMSQNKPREWQNMLPTIPIKRYHAAHA